MLSGNDGDLVKSHDSNHKGDETGTELRIFTLIMNKGILFNVQNCHFVQTH